MTGRRRARRLSATSLLFALIAGAACTTSRPPVHSEVTIRGTARLDQRPFDAQFVGAIVLRDGLATPCQAALASVSKGRYSVRVLGARSSAGCGRTGARVVLWTFAEDRVLYSTASRAWPDGAVATFAADYSSTEPLGAAPGLAQFSGSVFGADGKDVAEGTLVEAYVGGSRCGVASVRHADDFTGYVIAVVGPEEVPGCTRGVAITFRVAGRAASHNPVANSPPGVQDAIDLRP